MQNINVCLFSNDCEFSQNLKKSICGTKDETVYKKRHISVTVAQNIKNASEAANFFKTCGNCFAAFFAVRTSNFSADLKYSLSLLPFCENAVILLCEDSKAMQCECAEEISAQLKTSAKTVNITRKRHSLRKNIFFPGFENLKSGYQKVYLEQILNFSKNLALSLLQKGNCFIPLAPHILCGEKADIERICKSIDCDILDNIKILKELCLALEALKASGKSKKEALRDLENRQNLFVAKIVAKAQNIDFNADL